MHKDITKLHDMAWAFRSARTLQVANKINLFTLLSNKQLSPEQLCANRRFKPEILEKLLIACTAMGLLEKQGNLYTNTQIAETYLVRTSPLYQGDIIAHSYSVWNFWTDLENQICPNAVPYTESQQHRNFILAMQNIALSGRTKMFLDNIDLTGRKKLFDVGGGPGTYSIEACKRYPNLKAIVFDLPETIAITNEMIAKENMQHRVSARQGNWETDNFGHDNDVVLISEVMHGPNSQAQMKLQKAYDSMQPGSLLIIQEFLLNNDKTAPLIPTLFNLMVGAFSEKEILELIESAGFAKARIVTSNKDVGSTWLTAIKP